jgi:hypothetical protein
MVKCAILACILGTIGAILLGFGIYVQVNVDNIKIKDAKGEIINIYEVEIQGDFAPYIAYVYTLNITSQVICSLDPSTKLYKLHEIVTNIYVYKDGSCAIDCRKFDCVDYAGIILLVIGSVLLSLTILWCAVPYVKENYNRCIKPKYSVQR